MTNVYQIYQEVLSRVNKEENGYLPADLFNTYAAAADRTVFNDYNTRLQNPQTTVAEKMKLEDRLAPFEMKSTQAATGGIFTVPADCAYFRAAKIANDGGAGALKSYGLSALLCEAETDPTINAEEIQRQLDELSAAGALVAVDLLDHDRISKRLNSYVPGKKPSLRKPVMERVTFNKVPGFLIYPNEALSVYFSYYRRPAAPKLVMRINPVTLELEYDPVNSVDFEWMNEAMNDVANKIENDFAVYIREGSLFQMTQAGAKP